MSRDTGDYSDGVEDSVVSYYDVEDPERLRYAAAQKGLIASQKAVLLFHTDSDGPDMGWNLLFNTGDVGFVCRTLDNAGIENRSIKTSDDKTGVIVIDIGSELVDNVIGLKEVLGGDLSVTAVNGRGEFIGADTRQKARVEFGKVIAAYESRHPRSKPKLEDHHGGGDAADQQGSAASPKEALIDQMNALADNADAEGRPMTPAERSEFYKLSGQMWALHEAE